MSLRRRFTDWLSRKARKDPTVTPEDLIARQDFVARVEQERKRRAEQRAVPGHEEADREL